MNANNLYYKQPGVYWMDALPIGNGSLGAMCLSGTSLDTMVLNHDTLWSGHPYRITRDGAPESWKRAQALSAKGDYLAAYAELKENFTSCWSQAYLTFGKLRLDFGDVDATDYERRLDLRTAVLSSSYKTKESAVKKTAFVSHPHDVLVYRIESDQPISFTASFDCPMRHTTFTQSNMLILDGECPGDVGRNIDSYPCDKIEYFEDDTLRGVQYRGALQIESDGEVFNGDASLSVKNATCTTLWFTIQTSFNGADKLPYLEGKEYKDTALNVLGKAAEAGYEAVKAAHIADYTPYYDRVSFTLGEAENDLRPTDERLRNCLKDRSDMQLYPLLFNFGRYLLIASSREDSRATNLQGIWNDRMDPPWNCNYTVNINTEMNYWPALACNLPELMQPLNRQIEVVSVTGEQVAKDFYNAGGFVCHHNTDLWGFAVPTHGNPEFAVWPGSSGWLCRSLFEQYEYSLDEDFLRNIAFPLIKKAAQFYLDIMIQDTDGTYMISPGTSPENLFVFKDSWSGVSKSAAMLNTIALDTFVFSKRSCEILGIHDEFYAAVCDAAANMKSLLIGKKGDILEWNEELEYTDPHHRHVSHLYALHPAQFVTKDTPELFEAAKQTLRLRGDDGTGWSLAWKINFWARLLDGDHALKLIDRLLTPVPSADDDFNYTNGGGLYPNLLDAHPPFQIDGNFGAVSGICEMLLQSDEKNVYLLPALPKKWANGAIKGLAARGNITVDIEWEDSKITDYTIRGDLKNRKVILP